MMKEHNFVQCQQKTKNMYCYCENKMVKFQKFCIMKVSRVHKIYTRVDMGHIYYIKTIIGRRKKKVTYRERGTWDPS